MIISFSTPPAGRNKQQATWDLGTQQNQDNEIYNNIDIKIKPCSDSKVAADVFRSANISRGTMVDSPHTYLRLRAEM